MFQSNITDPETKEPLALTVRLSVGGTDKVVVRWPTDDEWAYRTSQLKIVQRSTGRNKTKTEAKNAIEVNAALYRKICLNGHGEIDDKIDDETASFVIDKLEESDVGEITHDGSVFTVPLEVKGGTTHHYIDADKITKARHLQYRRGRSEVHREGANVVIRSYLGPGARLYDQCIARAATGYAGDVPIIHKSVVVDAVLEAIEQVMSEDDRSEEDVPGEY